MYNVSQLLCDKQFRLFSVVLCVNLSNVHVISSSDCFQLFYVWICPMSTQNKQKPPTSCQPSDQPILGCQPVCTLLSSIPIVPVSTCISVWKLVLSLLFREKQKAKLEKLEDSIEIEFSVGLSKCQHSDFQTTPQNKQYSLQQTEALNILWKCVL